MSELALGLMSGTSADGVSLALARFPGGGGRRMEVVAHATVPYPRALRERLLSARELDAAGLCRLNFELGRVFAAAAAMFLRSARVPARRLSAVGSHGATVVHLPEGPVPSTLQIGEPSFLAEALGVSVVSDFRPRDMAAGGQGAPLVPLLDERLFGDGPPRALQNVGGIANVALVGRGVRTLAFDTGPGNCLIDLAVRRLSRGRRAFDEGGRLAARGRPDRSLAARLARQSWFLRRPPKSLDRGAFADGYLEAHFSRMLRSRPEDAVATITYFTALTIAEAYRRFVLPRARVSEAVVSGGGALNAALMGRLRELLAPVDARSIADFGIPPLAKEPAAFALMALKAVRGEANHVPGATGAGGPRILGKITPGRNFPLPISGRGSG